MQCGILIELMRISSHILIGCSPESRGRRPGATRTRTGREDGAVAGVRDQSPAPWPTYGGHRQPTPKCSRACGFHPSLPHPTGWSVGASSLGLGPRRVWGLLRLTLRVGSCPPSRQYFSQSNLTGRPGEEGEHETPQRCACQCLVFRPHRAARGLPDFSLTGELPLTKPLWEIADLGIPGVGRTLWSLPSPYSHRPTAR